MVQTKFKVRLLEHFLLLGEAGLFVLLQPCTGWMRPSHMVEGNLLTSSPQTKGLSHPKHPPSWHMKLTIRDIRSKPRRLLCGACMALPSPPAHTHRHACALGPWATGVQVADFSLPSRALQSCKTLHKLCTRSCKPTLAPPCIFYNDNVRLRKRQLLVLHSSLECIPTTMKGT